MTTSIFPIVNAQDKSMSFYHSNKKDKAIRLLKQCQALSPDDLDVYGSLGNSYADIGDYENSFKSFKQALDIVPNEPYILRNYIMALLEDGHHNRNTNSIYIALELAFYFCEIYYFSEESIEIKNIIKNNMEMLELFDRNNSKLDLIKKRWSKMR